jgi:hypothetical protein
MTNPAANNPTGDTRKWWWWVPEYRRIRRVEKRREEALSCIRIQRSLVEEIKQGPRAADDVFDTVLYEGVLQRLSEIENDAQQATKTDHLDDLRGSAEQQGQLRAYLFPVGEIRSEAALVIDVVEEWGVPKTVIDKLHIETLKEADTRPPLDARTALRAVFEEHDSWAEYTDDYEDTMTAFAGWLFPVAIVLPFLAVISLYFSSSFPPLLVFGLLCAGASGSCVSVLAKMPAFGVGLSAELESYRRRIFGRIALGAIASLIGCALLAWGIFPISLQNQTFADCLATAASSPVKALILLGVAMLLGFSERTIESVEQRMFGSTKTVTKIGYRRRQPD